MPKVMTVASASTHPAGGPQHAVHEPSDSHSQDIASESKDDGPAPTPSFSSLLSAPGRAWKATGLSESLPEVGMPKGGKSGEYRRPDRGLNDEEKRGRWVLGGIIGLGFLLGGSGKRGKESKVGGGPRKDEGRK